MHDDFMNDDMDGNWEGEKESLHFIKVEGLGNDFIVINCLYDALPMIEMDMLAMVVCDRDLGLKPDPSQSDASDKPTGADGLALIEPSSSADFKVTIYNADGSRAEMCGNLMRALGLVAYEKGFVSKTHITVDSDRGIMPLWIELDDAGKVSGVKVDMQAPEADANTTDLAIETALGSYAITPVSMGNPHGVIFVDDLDAVDVAAEGPPLERHDMFPEKANIEFVAVQRKNLADMKVWERGVGITKACGTGACAVLVAGVLTGRLDRLATINLPGGPLTIEWNDADNHVYMTGPASIEFEGVMTLPTH